MAPSSLKKALGAVKDQTSISIAKVSSNVEPELDVAVIKATTHDPEPADDKHLREILRLTSLSRGLVAACVSAVSRRLSRTRDWIVALKSLSLLHRLLSDGDPAFLREILHATRPSGARLLNMSDFRDEAHSNSWDHAAFARAYAFYLDQRLECLLFDQKQSENGGHRWQSPSRAIDEESRSVITASRSTPVREMGTEKLLRRLQQLQQLLDRVLACRPSGRAKHNRLILIALYPVVKESFQLYADICDVLAAVLDRFFDMEYRECGKAFEAYVSTAKQIDELSSFYAWCKDTGVARSSEYPDVQRITDQLLGTLEGFMRDQTRRLKSPRREPVVSNPVREEEEEEKPPPAADLNSIRALPAADDYKEEEPKPELEIEKPVPVPPVVPTKQEGDLVDLREDSATADEQGNKLALALFSGPAAAVAANGTGSNGSWEAFPSDGDAKATSAWETPAAEPGKADWELALVETASSLSKQKAALGGGFDPLLLNGMYDQGTVRQHAAAQASGGGSASSAALPAPALRGAAQVLALPAPDGTVQVIGGDPFAASLSVAPPAYVQMAEMGKKQQLLVQEQQVWVQYQRDGMQGQVSLAKLDNNGSGYGFVPSPAVPYKMPVGYNGAVYSSYTTY